MIKINSWTFLKRLELLWGKHVSMWHWQSRVSKIILCPLSFFLLFCPFIDIWTKENSSSLWILELSKRFNEVMWGFLKWWPEVHVRFPFPPLLLWFVWCFLLLLPSWFLSSLAWVMFPSFIFLFFLNLGHACFLLILFDFFLPFLLLLTLHATALASTWNYIMVEDRNSSSSSWNVKLSIEVS